MDAAQALADLTEISSQIVQVAIVDGDGAVLASTFDDERRAGRFAERVAKLLEEADAARVARGLVGLVQLEAATLAGSIFIVLGQTGSSYIAAVTRPEPTVGLVFYDLKHCLRSVEGGATESPRRAGEAVEGAPGEPGGSGGTPSKAAPRRKKADASA